MGSGCAMINVLYFASVKEKMGMASESIDVLTNATGACLVDMLVKKGEPWQSALNDQTLLIAINQEMASWEDPVADGDEVAFFPPVTGG